MDISFSLNFSLMVFFLLASFIQKCSRSDPQLNTCLRNSFNGLKPYLISGIPEIGLPPMEPLKIDLLGIENNAGNIRIKGLFTNVVNMGASNFTVKEVRSDFNVILKNILIFAHSKKFLLNNFLHFYFRLQKP